MSDQTPCYVALCSICGRIMAASVIHTEDPVRFAEAQQHAARMIQAGALVSQMSVAAVRTAAWGHAVGCPRAESA